jgi:hypothetical protein
VIRSEKRLRELSATLKKKNSLLISEAIKLLSDKELFDGAIGLLASLYDETKEKPVQRSIEEFFNGLKEQAVRPEVVTEIRKPWEAHTISMLVASCWQSGLDYSDYLTDIARVFLKGDYATAIECMTVIEESVHSSSRARKDEIIKIIQDSPLAGTNEKSALTLELISLLER